MYYEYHLVNGVIIDSDKPYVSGFHLDLGEQLYDSDLDEWYEVDTFVEVSYCIIKQGEIDKNVDTTDDYWIEIIELGD